MAAVLLIITQCGCSRQRVYPYEGYGFGEDWLLNSYCYIKVSAYDKAEVEASAGDIEKLISAAFAEARAMEKTLSRTIESSDIGRFNAAAAGEKVEVSDAAAALVFTAQQFNVLTDGKFDISVGPLTSLWNFSADEPKVPSAEEIEAALASTGYGNDIEIVAEGEKSYLIKGREGTMLDLGALAKGFIGDCVKEYLESCGVERGVVSLGGNIVLIGSKEDGSPWTVGVENPADGKAGVVLEERQIIGEVYVMGGSVVTSGVYERCFEEDGVVYHHVLDPATGYPAETDLLGVTITGEISEMCDILSTSCLLLGYEKGREFIETMDGYEALFILADGTVETTEGLVFVPVK